jgi:hypothetical protein
VLQTNRFEEKQSLFYQLVRFFLLSKRKKPAGLHSCADEIRKLPFSDTVLSGEGLIIGVTKVADNGQ